MATQVYEIQLPNGGTLNIESETPPTAEAIAKAMAAAGVPNDVQKAAYDTSNIGDVEAGAISAAHNVGPSAAFLGTMGATSRALQGTSPLVRIGGSLVAGMGAAAVASMAQDKVINTLNPELGEMLNKIAEEHPKSSTVGRMAASGFTIGSLGGGIRKQLLERAAPAALGAGIAGGQEAFNRDEFGFQEGAGGRILQAAGENALLSKATRPAEALMGLGSRLAGRVMPNVVSSMDAAAGAGNANGASAGANEIAMKEPSDMLGRDAVSSGDVAEGGPVARSEIGGIPMHEAVGRDVTEVKDFGPESDGEPARVTQDKQKANDLVLREERYAQELVSELVNRDNRSYESVVNERQKFPDTESWIKDMERRLDTTEKQKLPEKLDGYQPVEPKEPLDFGVGENKPTEVQAGEGLDYLGKVKKIQSDLAREGVDLPRETAVKMANLTPEEFVKARQQLINSVPKTEKPLSGELKLKSLSDLDPAFFPPGEDMPHGTPQKIAAEGLEGWADSILAKNAGMANAGLDPIVGSAQVVKTGFVAGRKIAATIKDFKAWSEKMVSELGEAIKPHLAKIWGEIAPSGKAPVEFLGLQEMMPGEKPIELFNLTKDITGHPEGSTLSRQTLEGYGYSVPDAVKPQPKPRGIYESMVSEAVGGKKPAEAPPASTGTLPGAAQWTPAISKTIPGKILKKIIGGVEDNIGAISKPMLGTVRSYQELINDLRVKWSSPIEPWVNEVRSALTPAESDAFDRAVQGFSSGGHEAAEAILASKPNGKALVDGFRKAKDVYEDMALQQEVQGGRTVDRIEDAWPRQMLDYEKFRKDMSMEEISKLEETINQAENKKKRQLTDEEKADIVNSAISLTLRGKPSFLKERTIQGLTGDKFKRNYEPFDVAMANRIARVSTDVARRKFLGKGSPEDASLWNSRDGDFGAVLSREIAAGKINPLGQKEIVDNLKSLLHSETQSENSMIRLGNKLSRAQNFLFIGDIASAISQYADILNGVYGYGVKATARGYMDVLANRLGKGEAIRLEDLGLGGDTFAETAVQSRGEQNTKTKRVQDWVVSKMVGLSDKINKEGISNAARRNFVNAMKDPRRMAAYDKRYSEMFPDRWPQIKKDLMSKDFVEHAKLNDNTRFFIYNELARFQPLTMAQRAQFESSDPSFRFLYSLKRYWVKELNIIRTEGYEKLRSKDPTERAEGAKNLALFVALAAVKGAAVSTVKDLLFDRDVEVGENAIEGVAQLFGTNKFLASKMQKDPAGAFLSSYLVPPIANVAGDVYKDYGTLINDTGASLKTSKYIPIIGKTYYNRFGAGAEANEKAQARNAMSEAESGISSPTLAEFDRLLLPRAKKQGR